LNDPGRRFQTRLRLRSQNWAVLRTGDLQDVAIDSVTLQPRRLRLRMSGWVHNPSWLYSIQLGFSRSDLDWDATNLPNLIRDATLVYRFSPDLQVSFGQTKLPGNRQRVVSSGDQQLPDRAIANRDFTLDRDFGLQAMGSIHPAGMVLTLKLAVSSGEGRNGTSGDDGLAYTARGEWLPLGAFTQGGDYFEGDLLREPSPKLSVGGGAQFNHKARRTQGTLGKWMAKDTARDQWTWFGDMVFKWRGLALSAEYLRRDCDDPSVLLEDGKTTGHVLVGQGFNAQLSYLVSDRLEAVTRLSATLPHAAIAAAVPRTTQAALGLSWYLQGHRLKLQSDLAREELTGPGRDASGAWILRLNSEVGI
jgi:hypothetical protein